MPTTSSVGPRRQQAAILFADIYGYSRLMDRDELGTFERVTQSIGMIRALIGDYGGEVVQTAGEGVLALFEGSHEALRFAVTMQREFRNDVVWNADGERIAFRMGINEGEVLIDDASVQGQSVNIAARLQALAQPGGICVSGMVRHAVDDNGLQIRSLGLQQLKNIAQPIEAFAIELNGETMDPLLEISPIEAPLDVAPDRASVIVLPLDNLGGDPRNRHVCDGISGDIITHLSRFRDIFVIAQHSAKLIKRLEHAPKQVGEKLGVRYIACGGLQRTGRKIRLRMELIESEGQHVLWSDKFVGDLQDIFSFQDEVTDVIAARLATQIGEAERRRLRTTAPPDLRAYGLVLRGQELNLRWRREGNLHARRLFEQAASVDPQYGRSYAALSRSFNLEWRYGWSTTPKKSLDMAVEMAQAAIQRDEFDPRGYASLGFSLLYRKEHDSSIASYQRAMQLNPNDADIISEFADALVYDGQPERSIALIDRAMQLNPFYPDWYLWYLADAYNALGKSEDVIATVKKMKNLDEGQRLLAANYAHLGMAKEARTHAGEVLRLHPGFTISTWAERPPYKNPDTLKRYMEGLRRAGLPDD